MYMFRLLLLLSMLFGLVLCGTPYINNGMYDFMDIIVGCVLLVIVVCIIISIFSPQPLFFWRSPIYTGCGTYRPHGIYDPCYVHSSRPLFGTYGNSYSRTTTTTTQPCSSSFTPSAPSTHTSTSFATTKRR